MTTSPVVREAPALLLLLRDALATLVDLVLPRPCAGCGLPGYAACPRCAAALTGPLVLAAPGPTASPGRRGRDVRGLPPTPTPSGFPGARPSLAAAPPARAPAWAWPPPGPGPGSPPLVAAAAFEGAPRALLLAYKERGRLDLSPLLGRALARAAAAVARQHLRGTQATSVVLVPVPTTAAARRRRGTDHVARLAVAAARVLTRSGTPARVSGVLRVLRPGVDQAGLGATARQRNRSGAFALRPGVRPAGPGEITIVVDDIVTTGATCGEAMRALRAGGWAPPAGTAAVAATPLRHGTLPARRANTSDCPP
ncbi:ComF family protein [Parafrankia elaeagni]|uniref:ComF family protein n=1 Tax=Parafrankia elaeagni TaxID=222534 RepID=UPI0018A7E96D|nr:ComF family protein [Parafrankia elaeagni]